VNAPQTATYRPEVYDVNTLDEAMRVIVSIDGGTTIKDRWQKETPFLVEEIARQLQIGPESVVLDYGCGIGRVAKPLIERTGCRVVGVDFSKSMRLLAPEYVLSERFTVWSPEVLARMVERGFQVPRAICTWVLQHVLNPVEAIQLISSALSPDGRFYVLDCRARCVPTNRGYVHDGISVGGELRKMFEVENSGHLPIEITTPLLAEYSEVYVLRKRRSA
jgi:SAM-dependent methyltransferase